MDGPHGHWQNALRKSLTGTAQKCYEVYWTNPGSNIPRNISCSATSPFSQTIQVRRTRQAGHCWRSKDKIIIDVFQWTPSHVLADQQDLIYDRSAWTQDVVWKTYRKRWMIGMNSVCVCVCVCVCACVSECVCVCMCVCERERERERERGRNLCQ